MEKTNWCKILGWTKEQLEELRMVGYSYIRQGKYEVALPFFQALTVLDDTNAYDRQTLGAIYLELDDGHHALKHLNKALEIDPGHPPTLLNRTKALFMVGKKKEGLEVAKELKNHESFSVSTVAKALILAHS